MVDSTSPKHVRWEFGELEKTAVCEAGTGLVIHRPRPGDNQFTHVQLSQIISDHNYRENCEADEALIAAAPDLLAACRSLDQWSRGPGGNVDGLDYNQDIQDAVMGAREAIAKAGGQEVRP